MDEELEEQFKVLSERDKKRLKELKAQEREGTLSYTEKIELELLIGQVEKKEEEAEGPTEETDYEKFKREILGKKAEETPEEVVERVTEELEEFEIITEEEVEEEKAEELRKHVVDRPEKPRPKPKIEADSERAKLAVAFGAGAVAGYLLKDFIEEDDEEDED